MTAPTTTHRATLELGPSVINNELMWSSASGLMAADPQTTTGCLKKWYYEQVDGKKPPATAAQTGGTAMHSEIEAFHGGDPHALTQLALSGRRFIPEPGPGLLTETSLVPGGKIAHAYLQARGKRKMIPMAGHVDIYNHRGVYLDEEGKLQQDPPKTLETLDWKTTSDLSYAKTAAELAQNLQLVTYAEAGFRMWPHLEHARLTHVYFRTRGAPTSKLVTIRRTREQIADRWEYASGLVRMLEDVATERTADKVPGNKKACGAYRGCPHRGICSTYSSNSLDSLYGKVAQDFKESTMGLIANNPQIMQQAQMPQQQAPQPQPDMRAQLVSEEQQLRQQQLQTQITPQSFAEAWQRINRHGRGSPSLGGNAAQAYAAMVGQQCPVGAGYAGTGGIAGINLMEPMQAFQLANDLDTQAGIAQPQPVMMPAPAPVAPPAHVPPPAYTQAMAAAYPAAPAPQQMSILPPGAPESIPAIASQHDAAPAAPPAAPAPDAPKKTRGRPKKDDSVTAPEAVAAVVAQAPPPPVSAPASQALPAAATTSPSAFDTAAVAQRTPCCVLVNARATSLSTRSLASYVDHINGELARRYSVTDDGKPGVQDVRSAPKNSILSFGGWKGCVREVVIADPPAPGDYHLDTFMDELNEVVADALRVVAERAGWLYVRGVSR